MKKLILLLILIPVLSYAQYAGDTLITKTVSATQWDTVSFGRGLKSIDIHNQTGGVLSFAFRRNGDGKRDTVNAKTIANGNRVIIPGRKDTVIFLQSTVSGTAKLTVYYGSGNEPIVYYPVNSSGQLIINIPGDSIYVQRRNPTVTIDSLETGLDTTITITPNKNTKYIELMVIDTGATVTDSIGIAFTLEGQTVLLGAISSADGTQSLTIANNNAGRLYLIYLPSSAGGTITLYLKNAVFTANKETKVVIIQQ